MKSALAMILVLALLFAQGIAGSCPASFAACPVQKKCCCSAKKSCCAAKPASSSTQLPAAPVPAPSSSQLQTALTPPAIVLLVTAPASRAPAFDFCPSFPSGRISLYQRDCAYLI